MSKSIDAVCPSKPCSLCVIENHCVSQKSYTSPQILASWYMVINMVTGINIKQRKYVFTPYNLTFLPIYRSSDIQSGVGDGLANLFMTIQNNRRAVCVQMCPKSVRITLLISYQMNQYKIY